METDKTMRHYFFIKMDSRWACEVPKTENFRENVVPQSRSSSAAVPAANAGSAKQDRRYARFHAGLKAGATGVKKVNKSFATALAGNLVSIAWPDHRGVPSERELFFLYR